jgi:predicted esterase
MKRLLLLSLLLAFISLKAQAKTTSLQLIQGTMTFAKLWREASLPQHRGTPEDIISRYQRVIDTSIYLESPFKKWYLAVTHFGLARAYARLELTDSARAHIQFAVDNHFWNFDVMYADPVLRSSLGVLYLDSLAEAYKTRRSAERATWREQLPIVFGPHEGDIWRKMGNIDSWFTNAERRGNTLDSMYRVRWSEMIEAAHNPAKPPIIIALHGGNASYREFGSHWSMIGQMSNAYVITPPGVVRYSSLMNSWDASFEDISSYLLQMIEPLRDSAGQLPPIYLAGYSQGACIALKFGLVHPEIIKGVISFAGFMDTPVNSEMVAAAREAGLRIYAESGEYDSENFKNSLKQLKRSFDQQGGGLNYVETPSMIHELPEPFFMHYSKAWKAVTN